MISYVIAYFGVCTNAQQLENSFSMSVQRRVVESSVPPLCYYTRTNILRNTKHQQTHKTHRILNVDVNTPFRKCLDDRRVSKPCRDVENSVLLMAKKKVKQDRFRNCSTNTHMIFSAF